MDAMIMRCVATLSDSIMYWNSVLPNGTERNHFLTSHSMRAFGLVCGKAVFISHCYCKLAPLNLSLRFRIHFSYSCLNQHICSTLNIHNINHEENCYFNYVLNNKSNENQKPEKVTHRSAIVSQSHKTIHMDCIELWL